MTTHETRNNAFALGLQRALAVGFSGNPRHRNRNPKPRLTADERALCEHYNIRIERRGKWYILDWNGRGRGSVKNLAGVRDYIEAVVLQVEGRDYIEDLLLRAKREGVVE
jgi:hypothetical protein